MEVMKNKRIKNLTAKRFWRLVVVRTTNDRTKCGSIAA